MARLLQDQRVRATINVQERYGYTALHWTSLNCWPKSTIPIFRLLLQSGANPTITTNTQEDTALDLLREFDPTQNDAIALLEEYPSAKKDADKASLLVKGRRLVTISRNAVAPSYLRSRVLHDVPLPRVELMPAGSDGIEETDRSMLASLLGMGGAGMPRDVFRVVLDLLMPTWDPLRREKTGAAAG